MNNPLTAFIEEVSPTLKGLFDPIFILDTDLRIVWANDATLSVLDGLNFCESFCYQAVHGKDAPVENCLARECIRTGTARRFTVHEPRLGGWYDIDVSPIFDRDKKVVGVLHVAHSINELKGFQDALRKAKDFLSTIMNAVPDPICYTDREGRIIEANHAYLKLFEITSSDYRGRKSLELAQISRLPKEVFQHCFEVDQKIWQSKRTYRARERFAPPGRPAKIMDVAKIPIFLDAGPHGLVVYARDITEIEEERESLARLFSRYEAILSNAPIGVIFIGPLEEDIYLNKYAQGLFGCGERDLEALPDFMRDLGQFGKDPKIVLEKALTRADGRKFVARLIGAPIDSLHPDKGVLWLVQDVTREKELIGELKRSEKTFRTITELATDAIVVIDWEGRIVFWNPASERIFGYSREEALGENLHLLLAPPRLHGQYLKGFQRFLRTGKTALERRLLEFPAITKDGREIAVELAFSIMHLGGERMVLGLLRDITQRKREQEERRLLEEKAHRVQLLDSLGQLAGGIAHDFNNLLMGISGFSDLVLLDKDNPENIERHVKRIQDAIKKASQLTRAMLAYTGKQSLIQREVDLPQLLTEIGPVLRAQVPKKVRFVLNIPEKVPPIIGDPAQVVQSITNLVLNASEALEDKKGEIVLELKVKALSREDLSSQHMITSETAQPGDYVVISCRDTGCGMSQETLRRAFEPFFTTKFTGRGLGLSAVLGIVKGHGGAVSVSSEPGKGTLINLYFPVMPVR